MRSRSVWHGEAMHALSYTVRRRQRLGKVGVRPRRFGRRKAIIATNGEYVCAVPPSVSVRRDRFAQWVRRILAHAQTTKGWSVPKIAEMAGIGSNTIYRWRDGRGLTLPKPEQVVSFCDTVGQPAQVALRILWPGKHDEAPPAEMPAIPDDLLVIARKLQDPNVPERERYYLQETIRQLADRPTHPATERVLRRRGA